MSCLFWLVSFIFSCFSSNFACFSAIYLQFLPIGRTVWQSSFEQKLGRTELENLAPPDMKKFWQERIEFWQDRMVGPHLKITQLLLWNWLVSINLKIILWLSPINHIYVGRGCIRPPLSNICFRRGLMGSGGPLTHWLFLKMHEKWFPNFFWVGSPNIRKKGYF